MLRFRAVISLTLIALLAPPAHAAEPAAGLYEQPVLVVEPGMHTALLRRADVDASGEVAVTASDDGTVRVWSVADWQLRRTIRVPRGPGNVGKIFAVAMSPNGHVVAAGGWTSSDSSAENIYLFDPSNGAMLSRIADIPDRVKYLAFSPDGRYLAATLDGRKGLRVYDRSSAWAEVGRDTAYGEQSYSTAFATDGRLVTTSLDGKLRLYDRNFKLLKAVETEFREPLDVAFSPDGRRIAVGFLDAPAVSLFDGQALDPLPGPDVSGISVGDLSRVAWSADGGTLYAGGRYRVVANVPVVAWADGGAGSRSSWPAGLTTVMSLNPLPDGGLVVATADPWLGHFDAAGNLVRARGPEQADFRDQDRNFAVSPDGMTVDFGYEVGGRRRARVVVSRLDLTGAPPQDRRTAPPLQDGLEVKDWKNSGAPRSGGRRLTLDPYEMSRSLAIHPDGRRFVIGAEWSLRAFDANGEVLWRREVPGVVWAVNISGDGRLVLAAYGDGTLRWHRMDDGLELLALFPMPDGKNWVTWTPEGIYAATPGAYGVLRWHVNRGWDSAAEAIPVSEIPETNRPPVIRQVLPKLGTAGALAAVELEKIRQAVQRVTRAAVAPGARLHVLAIGVSAYGEKARQLSLEFAANDARDLASALKATQSGLYAEVRTQVLTDAAATRRGILRALETLRQDMTRGSGQDLAVLLFSGHGAMVDGTFYLLPYDIDAADKVAVKDSGLSARDLHQEIAPLTGNGRVLLLLDACRSGAATADGRSLAPDADVLRATLRAGNVAVLTSSQAGEDSLENPSWKNGAFTEVLLDALTTRGDINHDGLISINELAGYVESQVPQLTAGRQTPGIDRRYGGQLFLAGL